MSTAAPPSISKASAPPPPSQTFAGNWNKFLLKVKYSFYSTLVFVIFANPETFRIVNNMIGKTVPITTGSGLPTPTGFFLHAFLFFATMIGLMMLPAD
jgi:hypothetical protein